MAVNEIAMDALSKALKLEQDGHAFYRQAAERVNDATCKQTFASLAEEEQVHEAMIARQMQALREEGGFVEIPGLAAGEFDLSRRLFPPTSTEVESRVSNMSTELEALQMALGVEVTSYDFYRQAAQRTEDAEGAAMYRWLAGAELTHFNLLMSNYEAINQHASWT